MKELSIIKPSFNVEIVAKVKSLGEIEDNIQEVKDYAIKLNEYYKNIIFSEDSLKEAKEEKAEINKFKTKVADFRKAIILEYTKPIKAFESIAKETEALLSDTYALINEQASSYDDSKKLEKQQALEEYFDSIKGDIDFISFDKIGLNITLSASLKALQGEIDYFVNKVKAELDFINKSDSPAEILYEYKQNLDMLKSVAIVRDRHASLEAPKPEETSEEDILITFTVLAPISKIKALKTYMQNNNIKFS